MDKDTAKTIQMQALAVLQKAFPGYVIARQGGKIKAASVELKYEFTPPGGEKLALAAAKKNWDYYCNLGALGGLRPEDFGRTFTSVQSGKAFTIVEIAPRRSKFPLVAEDQNGRRYKFAYQYVKQCLDMEDSKKAATSTRKTLTKKRA